MRNLSDASFAHVFALVLDANNAGRRLSHWRVGDVDWRRERHTHSGPAYAFQCEVHTLTRSDAPAWGLLYVMETWWDETQKSVVRDNRWGRLLHGRKTDVFAWFRARADTLPP